MSEAISDNEYEAFRERAQKTAETMLKNTDGMKTAEIISGAITVIIFAIGTSSKTKEDAYNCLAALFSMGDVMLQEASERRLTNWTKHKDK